MVTPETARFVELRFEVLEVESEVEDVLVAGRRRLSLCFG